MLKDEGIILQAIDFKEYDQILTVFSLQSGIVKLIVKGAKRRKGTSLAVLTRIEFSYTKGSSDLWKCEDISLVDANVRLRNTLARLEASCELVQAVLKTQMFFLPTPHLYWLFLKSLEKIPDVKDPYTLSTTFLLKLMRHEGVFHLEKNHQQFSDEEIALTNMLAQCSHFSQLQELILEKEYRKKIVQLFSTQIQ